ncbi:hypothetical protein BDB01DRAFT_772007 [Pilobolus umbonatus]|nr:hypothetical protein BDB01DRAFT_772007 [Pilobolus umbonatus]
MLHSFTSHSSSSHSVTQDGKTTITRNDSHSHGASTTLLVRAIGASELTNVQTIGKQDPFVQFSLNYSDKKAFVKTYTHKNAGDSATWNQTFSIPLNGEPDLFVEVLDEESTIHEVIGFAAIPINQVVHSHGANLNGLFEIFTVKGERAGVINLQLAAIGFPNSQPAPLDSEPVQGQSYINEGHAARMKSSKNKVQGLQVGGALLGGALAIGAGFLGKKFYDDRKSAEEEAEQIRLQKVAEGEENEKSESQTEESHRDETHKAEKAESTHNQYSQHESRDENRNKGECEKKEKNKGQCEKKEKKSKKGKKDCRRNSGSSSSGSDSDSDSGSDSDGGRKSKGKGGKKWNPVGTYAAGDRVKYNGQTYVCLQGHTSNPTWQPGAAHSLWQSQ